MNATFQRLIPAAQLIQEIRKNLRIKKSIYDSDIVAWLTQAHIEMRLPIMFEEKACIVPIVSHGGVQGIAPKPCDYVRLVRVTISDCDVIPYFRPIHESLVIDRCENCVTTLNRSEFSIQERNEYFICSSNSVGKKLHLWYDGYFMDDGLPMFDRHYFTAYKHYVLYCLFLSFVAEDPTYSSESERQRVFASNAYAMAKNSDLYDNFTTDQQYQVMAMWSDPYRLSQNPYQKRDMYENTLYGQYAGYGTAAGWWGWGMGFGW